MGGGNEKTLKPAMMEKHKYSRALEDKHQFLDKVAHQAAEAYERLRQGGEAAQEQQAMFTIGGFLGDSRAEQQVGKAECAHNLGITIEDLTLAERGLVDPEFFYKILGPWASHFGYEKERLLQSVETVDNLLWEIRSG